MTAEQARELTKNAQNQVQDILDEIVKRAKEGHNYYDVGHISSYQLLRLRDLGYSLYRRDGGYVVIWEYELR